MLDLLLGDAGISKDHSFDRSPTLANSTSSEVLELKRPLAINGLDLESITIHSRPFSLENLPDEHIFVFVKLISFLDIIC